MSIPAAAVDEPLYGATPVQAVQRFFRRYVVFTGRASRSEFWWTYLFVLVVVAVLGVLGVLLGTVTASPADRLAGRSGDAVVFAPVTILLFLLAIVVPGIALVVRRFHDANLSGLLALLWLIPYLGGLVVLIMCILPSQALGRRFDRANAGWVPGAPTGYGSFGASPYDAPTAPAQVPAQPSGQPYGQQPSGRTAAPQPADQGSADGLRAADLSHALAPLLGADRGEVGRVAQRFRATTALESAGSDRLGMPDADVLTRYDEAGRLTGVSVVPRG